jgi:DNA-directed RNA polymerase specialized sigma24 family protein
MIPAANGSVWWDRDVDLTGKRIRLEVRSAAHDVWKHACRRTQTMLGDTSAAADLMESAVVQVSRYLDRIAAPATSRIHGLLLTAFYRGLRRHACKLHRLEFVGGTAELSTHVRDNSWVHRVHATLDLQKIFRQLSENNGTVLLLRAEGFEWKEIATRLGTSVPAIRNSFWREIDKLMSTQNKTRLEPVTRYVKDAQRFRRSLAA